MGDLYLAPYFRSSLIFLHDRSTNDIYDDLRPEKVKIFLEFCNHDGICTVENGCTCRAANDEHLDIYDEDVRHSHFSRYLLLPSMLRA